MNTSYSNFCISGLDARLIKRYKTMVKQHINPANSLASAIKDLASTHTQSFATTQAVWRFFQNDSVTLPILNAPLIDLARTTTGASKHEFALVAHDWSRLPFLSHTRKKNQLKMSHSKDVGYELQSSLLINSQTGLPIAPLSSTLKDNENSWSTLDAPVDFNATHLDALTGVISTIEELKLSPKLVHVIDREADSVAHLREWSLKKWQYLVRAKEGRIVQHEGVEKKVKDIANNLNMRFMKNVKYKENSVRLSVSETEVILARPAQPKRCDTTTGMRQYLKGDPLALRLVVAQLSDNEGNILTRWCLLSNVESDIDGQQIAQWYYWRWNIESFFKLIKSAGHDIESWLQQSAQAVIKRFLIACMACVLIWQLQNRETEEDIRIRQFLARLSGRQQKRGRMESAPALLAGLSILLNTLSLLAEYDVETLSQMANAILGEQIIDV
jgi:hypothetical protein